MTALLIDLNPGRYFCPVCLARFRALSDKKHHIRTDHPKET